ncbi:hypothetical protein MKW98_007194 [Papaver atlanticum]|uniref:Uncharacterized protein n=1 Tax=Papaver atlanticum TaxID=357466 RepID=A0AAD4XHJ9_9MAGN|nr:hypothetical protein MKW98_007194 [Papaver atlanticum]
MDCQDVLDLLILTSLIDEEKQVVLRDGFLLNLGRTLGQLKYLSSMTWRVRGELGTHSSRCSNNNIRLMQRNNANSLGYRCISNGRNEPSMVRHGFMGQMMSFPSDVAGMPMSPVDAQRPGSVQTLDSALASEDPEHQHVYQGKMKPLVMMIVQCKSNWLHFITVYLQSKKET